MKKSILFLINCIIFLNTIAQTQLKIGQEKINVGKKLSTINLLDNNKIKTGYIDYYMIKSDSNEFIFTDITYDLKNEIQFFYQYHFLINDINPDTTHISIKENTLGSHYTSTYFSVNIYSKNDSSFKFKAYENKNEKQNPISEFTSSYTSVFNNEKDAKEFARVLNDYFKVIFRQTTE